MSRMSPCVFLLVGLIPTAQFSGLQERSDLEVAIGDEATVIVEDVAVARQHRELADEFPDTTFQKRFTSHGSTRLLLQHHGKPLKIIAHNDGRFTVRQTRDFSAEDIENLTDHHPELVKYANAFPRETSGNTKVRITIETEVTYELASQYEFEQQHPELHTVYQGFKDAF